MKNIRLFHNKKNKHSYHLSQKKKGSESSKDEIKNSEKSQNFIPNII